MLKLISVKVQESGIVKGDLNTSHVKVNLSPVYYWIYCYCNLNTSHVKVNLNKFKDGNVHQINLNTSHVKVNHIY